VHYTEENVALVLMAMISSKQLLDILGWMILALACREMLDRPEDQ
jgi:hypothetical protein